MHLFIRYLLFRVNEKHENILNKNSENWDKMIEMIGKDFNSEVIHKNKYITAKI